MDFSAELCADHHRQPCDVKPQERQDNSAERPLFLKIVA
jgi:hypothetical protein